MEIDPGAREFVGEIAKPPRRTCPSPQCELATSTVPARKSPRAFTAGSECTGTVTVAGNAVACKELQRRLLDDPPGGVRVIVR